MNPTLNRVPTHVPMQTTISGRAKGRGSLRVRLTAFLSVAAVLVATLPTTAWAHGALRRSEPAEGAHLTVAPRSLRLTFTEAVELNFARLALSGPDGAVALGALTLAPDSSTVLVAPVTGSLAAGAYTVAWQVAGEDGHPVRGQIRFMIAPGAQGLAAAPAGPPAPGQAPPPATHHEEATFPTGGGFDAESPLYVVIRWLTFLGLVGVLGAVAFRLVLWGVHRQDTRFDAFAAEAGARAARLGLWMVGLVAVAALLRLYAQSYALHGGAQALQPRLLGTMLGRTLWGWGWLLQAVGTVVAAAGFLLARRSRAEAAERGGQHPTASGNEAVRAHGAAEPRERAAGDDATLILSQLPSRASDPLPAVPEERPAPVRAPARGASPGWWIAGLGAVLLALSPGLSGHAVSTPRFAPLPVLTDAVHVIGAGGWLGSLLAVVLAVTAVLVATATPMGTDMPQGDDETQTAAAAR